MKGPRPEPETCCGPASYTPKVKRLPRLEATSRSGMRRRIASMKAVPVQCIGTTTSGARRSSSSKVWHEATNFHDCFMFSEAPSFSPVQQWIQGVGTHVKGVAGKPCEAIVDMTGDRWWNSGNWKCIAGSVDGYRACFWNMTVLAGIWKEYDDAPNCST